MFARILLLSALLTCLGCLEGQKPKPLPRAGATETEQIAKMPASVPTGKSDPATIKPAEKPTEEPAKPSLYDRLGKEEGISKVVDDFVANVVADDDIKEVHKKHFKEGDVPLLKRKLIDQIGQETGGPQKYTGKNMKDAHKGLEITNKDFDALVNDLAKAMDKNKVAEDDKNTILKVLETMRKDVVEKPD
jgi:hemoglobin